MPTKTTSPQTKEAIMTTDKKQKKPATAGSSKTLQARVALVATKRRSAQKKAIMPAVAPTASSSPGTNPSIGGAMGGGATTPVSATAAAAPAQPSVVNPVPTVAYPIIPASFAVVPLKKFKGYLPNHYELAAVAGAVSDLLRFTTYGSVMGASAVPAETLGESLSRAIQWRDLRDETEAFAVYVKTEDATAWKEAMGYVDEVRPLFTYAVAKNASLATQFPSLAAFLAASKELALEGAATRVKKAKAKAEGAKKAESAAASTPASPTSSEDDEDATTAPKTVTVTTQG
jgi:hypothetical protein